MVPRLFFDHPRKVRERGCNPCTLTGFAIESCFDMPPTSPQSSVSTPPTERSSVPMLDLTRQYETIKDDVHAAIERVLTSQHFIGGPELDGFERESASYLGVRESVGCALGN